MDILLAAHIQHINGTLVRSVTNRSARAAATRPAAVALRVATGANRKTSDVKCLSAKRLKRSSDAKRTDNPAGDTIATDDAKRFASKRF
jgi:hypothetical protein